MLNKDRKEKYVYRSEEDLWKDFKRGDEYAYEFMFKKYYNLLLSYGLRMNRNMEEIKDCIQQLFTGLWESRQRLGSNNSIRSYLSASLRRMILRRLNDKFHYISIDDISPDFHVDISIELKHIRSHVEGTQIRLLTELIHKLPDRQKEALYLKYYNDYSFSEIAETMGITTRGVYKLIAKAVDQLSAEIADKKLRSVLFG